MPARRKSRGASAGATKRKPAMKTHHKKRASSARRVGKTASRKGAMTHHTARALLDPWINKYAPRLGTEGTANFTTMPMSVDFLIGIGTTIFVVVLPSSPSACRMWSWTGNGTWIGVEELPMLVVTPSPVSVQTRRVGMVVTNTTQAKDVAGQVDVLVMTQAWYPAYMHANGTPTNNLTPASSALLNSLFQNSSDTRTYSGHQLAEGIKFIAPVAIGEGYRHNRPFARVQPTAETITADFQSGMHGLAMAPILLKVHNIPTAQAFCLKYLEQSNLRYGAENIISSMAIANYTGAAAVHDLANAKILENPGAGVTVNPVSP